jgi:hypothetical protein
MDFDDASGDFALLAIIFNHPILVFIFVAFAIIFAIKACRQEEDCAQRSCQSGNPMVVKGECICAEGAK